MTPDHCVERSWQGHGAWRVWSDLRRIEVFAIANALLYGAAWVCERRLFWSSANKEPMLVPTLVGLEYAARFGILLLYAWMVLAVTNPREIPFSGPGRVVRIFGYPLVLALFLALLRPYLSIDLYSYYASGAISNLPGTNAYLKPTNAISGTPLIGPLGALGWRPIHGSSPYGPLWTHMEKLVAAATASPLVGGMLLKGILVLSVIGIACCLYRIADRLRPGAGPVTAALFAWNPVILGEVAQQGHNDAIMALACMLALGFALRNRVSRGLLAQALAVLVKYVPALFIPVQLAYHFRYAQKMGPAGQRQFACSTLFSLIGVFALTVASFWPFWDGLSTFQGLSESAALAGPLSIPGMLSRALSYAFDPTMALRLTKISLAIGMLAVVATMALRTRSDWQLVESCFIIVVFYYFIVSGRFWPWYVTLPLCFAFLLRQESRRRILLVLTTTSALVTPIPLLKHCHFLEMRPADNALYQLVGVYVPIAFVLYEGWRVLRRRQAERAMDHRTPTSNMPILAANRS